MRKFLLVVSGSFPLWGKAGMGAPGSTAAATDAPLAPTPALPREGREKERRLATYL